MSVAFPILFAATLPGKIPDLRAPENPLPPGVWEQHGESLGVTGLLLLVGVVGWVWWSRRPKRRMPVSPLAVAREQLRPLVGQAETGALAGQVGRTMRGYLMATVKTLPPGELTADEIAVRLPVVAPWLGKELLSGVIQLLQECDRLKFSTLPVAGPLNLAGRAQDLLDKLAAVQAAEAQRVPPILTSMKGRRV